MAKGITQEQVDVAADALVAAGEKPTVEKIRQALGTGSPNTVTRMLDVWRGALAQRLQRVIALPEVPAEAGQAFAEVWRLALTHADTVARAALTEDQNALFAAQTSLTQERKLWEITLAEAQADVADGAAKLAQASAQLGERQALMEQVEAQRVDLLQQRDRLQAQLDQQRAEIDALRIERGATQEHVRTLEDRAHQHVDQARQEIKALQQRLEREQREHSKVVAQLTSQQEELHAAVRTAEQAAAHETGRVAALEAALGQSRSRSTRAKCTPDKAPSKAKAKPRKDKRHK